VIDRRCTRLLAATSCLLVLVPLTVEARVIQVPAGTTVYGVTEEQVTSRIKKDGTSVGDLVRAHAWRDVIVDGEVVVRAGAPMLVRVAAVKSAKLAGIKGKLELEALTVTAADGTELELFGGYDKSGHGRKALSITLAAVVAWPLIFIHGKAAILEPGTVFDASLERGAAVNGTGGLPPRTVRLSGGSLDVVVLYDEMDEGKSKDLPMRVDACGEALAGAQVVTVNDAPIDAVPLVLGPAVERDGCTSARATVNLKELGKHFTRGINRFEVEAAGRRAEVLLDIEL
jgi:hypothetical protein